MGWLNGVIPLRWLVWAEVYSAADNGGKEGEGEEHFEREDRGRERERREGEREEWKMKDGSSKPQAMHKHRPLSTDFKVCTGYQSSCGSFAGGRLADKHCLSSDKRGAF